MSKDVRKIWLAILLLILLPLVNAHSQENECHPKIGIALSTDWADLLTDELSRRYIAMEEKIWDGRYIGSFPTSSKGAQLPSGLVAGQKISNFLSRLTWSVHHIDDFSQLPIPFSCVAADIATGEAVPIDSGFLPDAIRASKVIPTVFTPVKIQDKLLVDSGLVRNLPAEDVKRMGADIIIGVDVSFALLPLQDIHSIQNYRCSADFKLAPRPGKIYRSAINFFSAGQIHFWD